MSERRGESATASGDWEVLQAIGVWGSALATHFSRAIEPPKMLKSAFFSISDYYGTHIVNDLVQKK